ncbi:MAG: peptidylprolyl isomerase [Undibacterium sp.]|nr:peptidylprolyl isomerase [Undibacterium sp.]
MSLMPLLKPLLWTTIVLFANANAQELERKLDPENTLVITSSKGQIVIEMRPELAPKSVERVKLLAREKVYDGLQFHRVIANFVAQSGNPNNKDGGTSQHPNLPPEMMFKHKADTSEILANRSSDSASGFLGSVPFQATAISDELLKSHGNIRAWGAHCPGVVGMGRGEAKDSANSEIYFMLAATRRLDKDYTVFGKVVVGMDVLLKLNLGEPPKQADVMQTVRVMGDIPIAERPKITLPSNATLKLLIAKKREEKGADFSVCDVEIPVRME